jgi:methylenetetrahydrofolate reductase (NADPH)
MPAPFEIICEVEPATRPDLTHVRHQIATMAPLVSRFLIPDNHIGRATVSSIAVAHEVARMGSRAVACVNARDRNLLGFRRDLLTAAAYGVEELLLVYGDRPTSGERTGQLTVRSMLDELRRLTDSAQLGGHLIRAAVTTQMADVPAWKLEADALYVQVSYSIDELSAWRDTLQFDGPVHAGVMVPPSAERARKLGAQVPQLAAPESWLDALDADPDSGVDLACQHLLDIRDHGGFDGVHLVPVSRYRQTAARLESLLR